MDKFIRSALLLGEENIELLSTKTVMIFGLGGVGSYVVEGLVRTGIKNFVLIDNDEVSKSNINRQIIATTSTIGKLKTTITKERILTINQDATVVTYETFVLPETINNINFKNIDFIVDCIDTISGKIAIIEIAKQLNIPVISSMGTGNKLDPTKFQIVDISKTHTCPLAKVMRYELKHRGIKKLKVLYSKEEPIKNENSPRTPSSISFVPAVAGLIIAGEVIKDIIKNAEAR